jgi:hypothetical protein
MPEFLKPFTSLRSKLSRYLFTGKLSLQMSIGSLLIILLVVLGTAITWYTYESQKKETLRSTSEIFKRAADQTSQSLLALMGPVESFISLSTQIEKVSSSNRQQRLDLIPYFVQALRNSRWLANVSVGYSNGDFIIIWSLARNELIKRQTAAPKDAAYLVKLVERNPAEAAFERYLFYDEELNLLSENDPSLSDYDPRTRPWYKQAITSDYPTVQAWLPLILFWIVWPVRYRIKS